MFNKIRETWLALFQKPGIYANDATSTFNCVTVEISEIDTTSATIKKVPDPGGRDA